MHPRLVVAVSHTQVGRLVVSFKQSTLGNLEERERRGTQTSKYGLSV